MSSFLHAFEDGMRSAEAIARRLGLSAAPISRRHFPDGESLVTVSPAPAVACLYCSLDHPNERLVDLLLAVDALRRNGAERLVLVAPYLCYMRQDKAFHPGEAVGQQAVARLLSGLFDRIVTVDPHLHRMKTMNAVFPHIEAESLSAAPAVAAFVKSKGLPSSMIVAGPDAESAQWVGRIGALLGCEILVGAKRRRDDRNVEVDFPASRLDGRPVLLADDIVSSGGTVVEAVKALKRGGAGDILIAVTHALFDPDAGARMRAAGASGIWSTDSVPHPTNAIFLDALLAEALRRETEILS